MENRCVCCGELIPEGRQVCPACEAKSNLSTEKIKMAGDRMPWWAILLIIIFIGWVIATM